MAPLFAATTSWLAEGDGTSCSQEMQRLLQHLTRVYCNSSQESTAQEMQHLLQHLTRVYCNSSQESTAQEMQHLLQHLPSPVARTSFNIYLRQLPLARTRQGVAEHCGVDDLDVHVSTQSRLECMCLHSRESVSTQSRLDLVYTLDE